VWFHVDGAFGALAMLSTAECAKLTGIELADSIAFDFHKWAQVPYDAGFILVRDGALHHDTFAAPAAYLQRDTRGLAGGSPWPCDFGPDLSRGFRALKTWMTISAYGAESLGQVIADTCQLAREFALRVAATPELELMAPVALNIVCFRFRSAEPAHSDDLNRAIVADLHESGLAAPSTTVLHRHLVIRVAIVNHRTRSADLDRLLAATLERGKLRQAA
ncbi:MAG: pyridoxal-dependent decarboxylase, partial [Pseudomonadota bacterium]|nr:pyridoxal-dependent decarboxylase [Pseudomonadota bacterium]